MRFTDEELLTLFSHLEGCAAGDMPLPEALRHAPAEGGRRLQRVWPRISEAVDRGIPLSEALRAALPHLDPATVTMVAAGENHGDLAGTFALLRELQSQRRRFSRAIQVVMIQPALTLIVSLLVMMLVGTQLANLLSTQYLQMRFLDIFAQLGAELPSLTIIVYRLAPLFDFARVCRFVGTPAGLLTTTLIIASIMLVMALRPWQRPGFQRWVLPWIPMLGPLTVLAADVRWCHTVGQLLRARVPVDHALSLAETTLGDPRLERAARLVQRQVEQGCPLATAMCSAELLPSVSAGVLLHAERNGRLPEALQRLAHHLQDRLQGRMDRLQAWLEPVLTIVVGIWVLVLVLGTYLIVNFMVVSGMLPLFTIPRIIGVQ